MTDTKIDLFSDTVTKPTEAMRQFACAAEVGDEQFGLDPTVNELNRMVAEMLGKEAAVFLPSGTMCNQIALAVHCPPGEIIVLDRTAHPLISEGGGVAVLAGATLWPLDGELGMFTAEQLSDAMPPSNRYRPPVRIVSIEQTTNSPGGRIWPLEQIREVCAVAHEAGARTHMDGARLFHAVVATGIDVSEWAASFDSLWIDLSKGLGAPVGAVLAGSSEFIEEAWQWKQRIGGAMRQAGIIAAAGIYALRHHIDRLAEDHENAKRFAQKIEGAPGIEVDPTTVETNIVRFGIAATGLTATEFAERLLAEEGVRISMIGKTAVRVVPHLGNTQTDIDEAAALVRAFAERLMAER